MLTPGRNPLISGWQISCGNLPERFRKREESSPALPGFSELEDFSDLLETGTREKQEEPQDGICSLPMLLPEDLSGSVIFSRVIPYIPEKYERLVFSADCVWGCGKVFLGDCEIAAFDRPHALKLELPVRGKAETLSIRFDETRPAGIEGGVCLELRRYAKIGSASLLFSGNSASCRAAVRSDTGGTFCLETIYSGGTSDRREFSLRAGDTENLEMPVSSDTRSVCLRLYKTDGKSRCLCDTKTAVREILPARTSYYLPLSDEDCLTPAASLCRALQSCHIRTVSAGSMLPDYTREFLRRSGIAVISAAEEFTPPAPAENAWQMCGNLNSPFAIPKGSSDVSLLREACGRTLAADSPSVSASLAWLRALRIRLNAENMRQKNLMGPLCGKNEWHSEDVREALQTAFAPEHISCFPYSAAWWTGARFSASLRLYTAEKTAVGSAKLETENGEVLAELSFPADRHPTFSAVLPGNPCILHFVCTLQSSSGEVLERNSFPVYVGTRGPLETAF